MSELVSSSTFGLQAGNALAAMGTGGKPLPNVRRAETLVQARKVAEDFEAVFVNARIKTHHSPEQKYTTMTV